jgi:hypothetical protein
MFLTRIVHNYEQETRLPERYKNAFLHPDVYVQASNQFS